MTSKKDRLGRNPLKDTAKSPPHKAEKKIQSTRKSQAPLAKSEELQRAEILAEELLKQTKNWLRVVSKKALTRAESWYSKKLKRLE